MYIEDNSHKEEEFEEKFNKTYENRSIIKINTNAYSSKSLKDETYKGVINNEKPKNFLNTCYISNLGKKLTIISIDKVFIDDV